MRIEKVNFAIKVIISITLTVIAVNLTLITIDISSKKSYQFKKQYNRTQSWVGNYSKLEDYLREDAIYHKLHNKTFLMDYSTCRYR